jgi:hypothetical protein
LISISFTPILERLYIVKNFVQIFVVCLTLITFVGCGARAPYGTAELEGTASYKGKPLENVILTFSVEGKRESSAVVMSGGKFRAVHTPTIDGVPVGSCKVRVGLDGQSTVPNEWKELFQKYGTDSQGLEIEVSKSDKNYSLNFE